MWGKVKQTLDLLGPQGMSGDETDTAQSVGIKKVVRLTLPWLDPGITSLWNAVDTYENAVSEECIMTVRGNKHLERVGTARIAKKTNPLPNLPRNWYSNEWYRTLSPSAKMKLGARPHLDVPTLVSPRTQKLAPALNPSLRKITFAILVSHEPRQPAANPSAFRAKPFAVPSYNIYVN